MNIEEVKARLVDYVGGIEIEHLSMPDLLTYTNIVNTLHNMYKVDPLEKMYTAMGTHCVCGKQEAENG